MKQTTVATALNVLRGVVFCGLWYFSILAGYLCLFCPILPLVFLSTSLYRKVSDFITYQWQKFPTALLKYLVRCEIVLQGAKVDVTQTNLILVNHRTRTDWIFLWAALYYHTSRNRKFVIAPQIPVKFVLKQSVRNIPGIGWIMQLCCYLFVKRNWRSDELLINGFINYYSRLKPYALNLLLFPEGTDFTPRTKDLSDVYAKQNHLQLLKHVLQPRTTGFVHLVTKMRCKNDLSAIYDVTLLYLDNTPQTEVNLLTGKFPKRVMFDFERYTLEEIPKSELQLEHFLRKLWLKKDKYLENRHNVIQLREKYKRDWVEDVDLAVSLVLWTVLIPLTAVLLYKSAFFCFIAAFQTLFLLSFNVFFGNFLKFEAFLARLQFFERVLFFVIILLTYSFSFYFM